MKQNGVRRTAVPRVESERFLCGQVVDVDVFVDAARREMFPVRRERDAGRSLRVQLERLLHFAGRGIPHFDLARFRRPCLIARRRGEPLAIGRPRHAGHGQFVSLEQQRRFVPVELPDASHFVLTCRRQPRPLRRERDSGHITAMSFERLHQLTRRRIPDGEILIAPRHQCHPIERKHDGSDLSRFRRHLTDNGLRLDIDQLHGVLRPRCQQFSVRTERDARHTTAEGGQSRERFQLLRLRRIGLIGGASQLEEVCTLQRVGGCHPSRTQRRNRRQQHQNRTENAR